MKKSDIVKNIIAEAGLPGADLKTAHAEISKFLVNRLKREKIFEFPNVGFFTMKTYKNKFMEGELVGAIYFSPEFKVGLTPDEINFGTVKLPENIFDAEHDYFEMGVNKPLITEGKDAWIDEYRQAKKDDLAKAVGMKLLRYYNYGREEDIEEMEETDLLNAAFIPPQPEENTPPPAEKKALSIERVENLEVDAGERDEFVLHKTFEKIVAEQKKEDEQARQFAFNRDDSEFLFDKPQEIPRDVMGNPVVLDLQDIMRRREWDKQEAERIRAEQENALRDAEQQKTRDRRGITYGIMQEEEKKDIEQIRRTHAQVPEVSMEQIERERKEKLQSRIWIAVSVFVILVTMVVVYWQVIGVPEFLTPVKVEKLEVKSTVPKEVIERDYTFPINYPYPAAGRMKREREGMEGIIADSLVSFRPPLYEVGVY